MCTLLAPTCGHSLRIVALEHPNNSSRDRIKQMAARALGKLQSSRSYLLRFTTRSVSNSPIARVDPASSLGVVVDIIHSAIVVSGFFPAQRKRYFTCFLLCIWHGVEPHFETVPSHLPPCLALCKSHSGFSLIRIHQFRGHVSFISFVP